MGFYYFDYTYLLFLAPAIIITMIAQIGVKTTFNKYSKVLNMKGLTGAAAAQRVFGTRWLFINASTNDRRTFNRPF